MKRCAVTLTSGGRIIVKGDFEDVSARLRGSRKGLITMTRLTRKAHTKEFDWELVLIAVEHVTCVYEVKE